jgi:ferritin
MISDKMALALNEQINREMSSGYVYMALSAQMAQDNWNGFSKWFMVQYHEEMYHAMKIFKYLLDHGARVELRPIEAKALPEKLSVLHAFEKALEHEQMVTQSIHRLVKLARELDDYATEQFLQWYVKEQVEEEKNASENIAHLKRINDSVSGLYFLDKKLGKRELEAPANFAEFVFEEEKGGEND